MINQSELRIGNLVYDGNNEITSVSCIVQGSIDYEFDFGQLWIEEKNLLENCLPIPITEEWLLRFGFEVSYTEKVIQYKKKMFRYSIVLHGPTKGQVYFKLFNTVYLDKTKYVHQLQNLYFALTGEELTLKAEQ